uniref:Uncharacterized protein n=1 Tax=Cacopsylla melanoneura TaxID=428564 RepID=A0A8D8QJU0_9HEMI
MLVDEVGNYQIISPILCLVQMVHNLAFRLVVIDPHSSIYLLFIFKMPIFVGRIGTVCLGSFSGGPVTFEQLGILKLCFYFILIFVCLLLLLKIGKGPCPWQIRW